MMRIVWKLALLYVLEDFLLAKDKSNVDSIYLMIVEDLDYINSFPWARFTFDYLMTFLYKGFREKVVAHKMSRKVDGKVNEVVLCAIGGFPEVFQV